MDTRILFDTILLGLIEGITEFLPVSSTGHLILAGHLLNFEGPPGKVFEVVIQLGAILAVCVMYWRKLFGVAVALPLRSDAGNKARHFVTAILLGFFPSALLGVLMHDWIKTALFSPLVVSIALITGGFAILLIEHFYKRDPHVTTTESFSWVLALKIGLFQCLALIPGMSRSGATILGALLMGVERKTAAEFSFFVAIPTMLGATVYDVYKNRDMLSFDNALVIGIGFITAFIAALIAIRFLLQIVSRYNFKPFGWYRIIVGAAMLALLFSA